jgi:Holliday junction DNA helicase RuvA
MRKLLSLQFVSIMSNMYAFISGKVVELTPAYAVIDNNGIGYFINITLNTFTAIGEQAQVKLYTHLQVLEDAHNLFGFYTTQERDLFEMLITVSGVGCNTARLILSSLTVNELSTAIANEDVRTIQSVKGIGTKTAQRLVVDLKDKVKKTDFVEEIVGVVNNTAKNEALTALVTLGFGKNAADKALNKILKQQPDASVEIMIREALKLL